MSTPEDTRGVKTLAIRLEPEVHAQLSLIAQLKGGTITDELKLAVLTHIESAKSQADLANRASFALEEIEREAALRRDAIASLFAGSTGDTPPTSAPDGSGNRTRPPRRAKATDESSDS